MTLTIGMATYEDFEGAWMTLEALHSYHPKVEYLVIDNAPTSCGRTKATAQSIGGRYVHRPDLRGTSAPRDALFRMATTDWVMCVDSHVLLEPGAVADMLAYAEANPDSKDILTGPLIYDDGRNLATHWRADNPGLWGVWDTAWQAPDGTPFTFANLNGRLVFRLLNNEERTLTDLGLPMPTNGASLDQHLKDQGCVLGGWGPFPIPMQGLGLFAMRRRAWPGFNPLFRGFGGEEGYIHEKVRQRGGRALYLPGLRWRHRFRHMEHGAPPPPYPLSLEDHTWNLLVGHRELGVEALPSIRKEFGDRLPQGAFDRLLDQAEKAQELSRPSDIRRLRILGVWYSNNSVHQAVLQKSLESIRRAAFETMHHDVDIITSTWHPVPGNPFPCIVGVPRSRGNPAIVEQIQRAVAATDPHDVLCFLEHDGLYPPGYFDLVGRALATFPAANVASNLDYEGLNRTGFLAVRERHEPMHQLSIRWDAAMRNLERCADEGRRGLTPLLEPQGDRSDWIRMPPVGLTPSIHINVPGRNTNHGEVVYEETSRGRLVHPFWGDYRQWWPLAAEPDMSKPTTPGCKQCGKQGPTYPDVQKWYDAVKAAPADFHEHMDTMRRLAGKCDTGIELSKWNKPGLLAMAAGGTPNLISVCPHLKNEWPSMQQLLPGFKAFRQDSLIQEPFDSDILFIDTDHQAARLYAELERWAPKCKHYVVIHCTVTFGEIGDDGGPGVLHGIRKWLAARPEWRMVEQYQNNNGMMVFSRHPEKGPGTELHAILRSLGIDPGPGCDCHARADQMDDWGVEGCREHFDEIVGWLNDGQGRWGWKERLSAAAKAVATGLAFKLNLFDPYPSLVEEAIRRAEVKGHEVDVRRDDGA